MIPIILLFICLVLNFWAQIRVNHALAPGFQRTMISISIWVLPFFGAFFSQIGLPKPQRERVRVPNEKLPSGFLANEAPDQILLDGFAPFEVIEHLLDIKGLPILKWKSFAAWRSEIADPAMQQHATTLGQRAWLHHLRNTLCPHSYFYETDTAFVISSLEPNVIVASAKFVATTRKRISRLLPNVARFPQEMKSILLVLDDADTYYRYLSIYYPDDGDFALSGGVFIDAGCPHFVTVARDLSATEPVITHELTHSALSYLRLPKWLDEGIAVNSEQRLSPSGHLGAPREMHQKHQQFWNTEAIQEFWSGHSFDRQDDGNLLSYDLARILVAHFSSDWNAFEKFVLTAERHDGGNGAAQKTLAVDLGHCVCSLFGFDTTPEWSPAAQAGKSQ